MRISKDGRPVLSRYDHRVGNFVFTDHEEYVKLQDISRTVVLRISKRTTVARLVGAAVQEGNDAFLRNYAAMAFYVNGTVPDVEFWRDMNGVIGACLERHPELYGVKAKTDDASDEEVIREEREFREAVDELSRNDGRRED